MSRISLRKLTIKTAQLQRWLFFQIIVCISSLKGAIFLSLNRSIDSLNPTQVQITELIYTTRSKSGHKTEGYHSLVKHLSELSHNAF